MSQLSSTALTFGQGLFTDSATQFHVLGDRAFTPDGRGFVYVKAGGTSLVAGKMQQTPAQDTTNFDPVGGLSVAAAAVGALTITTTTTVTLTANQIAGGYVSVVVAPGIGNIYRVKSHPAVTTAAVTLTLEDPILVALTTSSKINLTPNAFDGVIVTPATTLTGAPIGVANAIITNAQFGWIQNKGVASCLIAATAPTIGVGVASPSGTIGAVAIMAATLCQVGYAMHGTTAAENDFIYLTIGA